MGAVLKAGDIRPDDLAELVAAIRAPDRLRIWAEGADGWALDYWGGHDEAVNWYAVGRFPTPMPGREVLGRSIAGRIFAPSGELKWRRLPTPDPQSLRLVFLGEVDWLPGHLKPRDELDHLDRSPRRGQAVLWGQRTEVSDGDWVEPRIPHRFRYPVPERDGPTDRPLGVRVLTETWCDRRGEPHFVRLCDLEAYTIREDP